MSAAGVRQGVLVDITAHRLEQAADERRLQAVGDALAAADRVRRLAADELHDHALQVLTAALVLLDRIELRSARGTAAEGETASVRQRRRPRDGTALPAHV